MIKGWDLTIYELLGYMVPGVLAFGGCFLLAALEQPEWLATGHWSGLGWWVALPLVVAYVLGHLVQALGNLLLGRRSENAALDDVLKEISASGFQAIARRLAMPDPATDGPSLKASPRSFLALCTEIVDQDGKPGMRDVFLYREGFYRGSCIALVFLAAGLAAVGLKLAQPGESVVPTVAAALSALTAVAFVVRYKRFVRYRISTCLWGAVIAATAIRPTGRPPGDAASTVD